MLLYKCRWSIRIRQRSGRIRATARRSTVSGTNGEGLSHAAAASGCPYDGSAGAGNLEITSYREVEEILARPQQFSLADTKGDSEEFARGTVVGLEGGDHRQRRRLLAKIVDISQPWGPRGSLLTELFEGLIAPLRERAAGGETVHFDLIPFARQVYGRMAAALIGIDGVDSAERLERLESFMTPIIGGLTAEFTLRDLAAITRESRAARQGLKAEFFDASLSRRAAAIKQGGEDAERLPGDLITQLLSSPDGGFDEDAIFRECVVLFAASVNNPVSQIANCVNELSGWLAVNPSEAHRLDDDAFLNDVVRETLRLHRTGNPYLLRAVLEDVELSTGRHLKAGERVALHVGPANRDPEIFGETASQFDPLRAVSAPRVKPFGLAFGGGPHACLGRPLVYWERGDPPALGYLARLLKCLLTERVAVGDPARHSKQSQHAGDRFSAFDVTIAG
ncbi:cytochrome P450 [Streptomyces sp. NPDC057137]|uniref:cytochrome P450 n=1 Tax=Streptomyces sp. NPDC057137 TaxID=3346030 RepID=UPI00363194FA